MNGSSTKPRVLIVTHYVPFRCTLSGSSFLQSVKSPILRNTLERNRRESNFSRFNSSLSDLAVSFSSTSSSHPPSQNSTTLVSPDSHLGTWHFSHRRDHSALYAGILSIRDSYECIVIGQLDKIYDEWNHAYDICALPDELKASLFEHLFEDYQCVPIFIDYQTSYGHYEGFCKGSMPFKIR